MTLDQVLLAITKDALGSSPSDEDALAAMVLLHTHRPSLRESLSDRAGVTEVEPVTQRHAAELVAAAWVDRGDQQRTRREHWYYQFNTVTPFEVIEDVTAPWGVAVARVRRNLLQSGLVAAAEPED
jgi:hypothetical protein